MSSGADEHRFSRRGRRLADHAEPVPIQPELCPVDVGGRRDADRAVTELVDRGRQRQLRGNALDGEGGAQVRSVTSGRLKRGDDDADLRKTLDIEEVGRAQVIVSLSDASTQRCYADVETTENGPLPVI
ncbi:hypothetical protein I553_6856 [Mycobacterium xenopi 4042]|uniref:Uncharacterized protein n=1 Tax=Mycobacterium xenopi 4042 TaxID=1299334 RepID=X7Z2P8_MYCXE|nr:hypothetical protein I553_6856 [Mycobacterium xenopi 4042]